MENINLSPLLSTPPDFQGFGGNFDLIDKAIEKITAPTFNRCCFKKISTYLYLRSKKNIKSDEEFFKKFHLLDKISEINFSNRSFPLDTLSSWEQFLENWDPIYKNNKNLQDAKSSIISFKMRLQNLPQKTQAILIPNNNERILSETPFGVEYQQEKEIAQTSLGSWITTSSSLESASKYEYDPLKEGHEDLVGVMDPSALSPPKHQHK